MEWMQLANGVKIPQIGYGTYKAVAGEDKQAIRKALELGYRHLDTAAFYGNEEVVGQSVLESGIPREDIFITSKVWRTDMGYDRTMQSFENSLKRLQLEYLDLFLIHWPVAVPGNEDWKQLDLDTWRALEQLYREGRVKAIGVSNFLPHHLINLFSHGEVMPMVNQLEFHPGYTQWATVEYCKKHNILVEAWSPIGRARVLQEPLLMEMAEQYGKSIAQICIRFALQCGVVPLPKSASEERMKQNLEVYDFEITESDMYRLLTLPETGWSGEHPDRL